MLCTVIGRHIEYRLFALTVCRVGNTGLRCESCASPFLAALEVNNVTCYICASVYSFNCLPCGFGSLTVVFVVTGIERYIVSCLAFLGNDFCLCCLDFSYSLVCLIVDFLENFGSCFFSGIVVNVAYAVLACLLYIVAVSSFGDKKRTFGCECNSSVISETCDCLAVVCSYLDCNAVLLNVNRFCSYTCGSLNYNIVFCRVNNCLVVVVENDCTKTVYLLALCSCGAAGNTAYACTLTDCDNRTVVFSGLCGRAVACTGNITLYTAVDREVTEVVAGVRNVCGFGADVVYTA